MNGQGWRYEVNRYLGEYQYRFDLATMLPRLLVAATQTSRRPEAWLQLRMIGAKQKFGCRLTNGLVLAICPDIINKHGGKLELANEIGMGTTLSVSIPAVGNAS